MSPGGWSSSYEVQDLPKDHRSAQFNTVATNYFDVMGIDIVKGRPFSPTDRVGSPLVAVINQTMARTLWPNQSAVGKHIKVGNDQHWREVIGVARDVKRRTLTEEPSPYLYLSMSQPMPFWRTSSTILIQTQLPPESVVTPARNVVRSLDSRIPLYGIRTLSQQFAYSYWQQRIAGWLIGAFATLALLLAAVGVYGVISYEVTARTREVGIRMALGARQHEVLGLVLRRGAILAACGIGLGAVAGLLLTRALKALLFGISSYDPATFALTALLLATVALAASFVPARRAARVDPMVALRYE
jgi:predicted permease